MSPRRGEGVGTARCAVRGVKYARFAVIDDRDCYVAIVLNFMKPFGPEGAVRTLSARKVRSMWGQIEQLPAAASGQTHRRDGLRDVVDCQISGNS